MESQKLFVQLSGAGSFSAANFGSQVHDHDGDGAREPARFGQRPAAVLDAPGCALGDAEITGLAAELNAVVGGDAVVTVATDAPGVLELDVSSVVDHAAAASWGGQATTDITLAALEPLDVIVPFVGGSAGAVARDRADDRRQPASSRPGAPTRRRRRSTPGCWA